jgi:glycosyltransferase involved in cell wall biosynthesis
MFRDRAGARLHLAAYFPMELVDAWHCHALLEMGRAWNTPQLSVTITAPMVRDGARSPLTRSGVPAPLTRVANRLNRHVPIVEALGRLRYARELKSASAAYLWSGVPRATYEDVVRAGVPLFVERINCHRRAAKRVLDEVQERAGVGPVHSISERDIQEETDRLGLANFIFAPSEPVRESLLEVGIPADKILRTSYGYAPRRVPEVAQRDRDHKPVFLFLGSVCLRKGAHIALEAWARAGVDGKLVLCGQMTPEVEALAMHVLRRRDVDFRGFVPDVHEALAEADVLVLPTFTEGSPFVVYEAMAAGVVPLVTPMGAGDVVRAGQDGLVVPPFDVDALASAMTELANHPDLRAQLSASAAERATDYTWDKVAARRRCLFLSALAHLGADVPATERDTSLPLARTSG